MKRITLPLVVLLSLLSALLAACAAPVTPAAQAIFVTQDGVEHPAETLTLTNSQGQLLWIQYSAKIWGCKSNAAGSEYACMSAGQLKNFYWGTMKIASETAEGVVSVSAGWSIKNYDISPGF